MSPARDSEYILFVFDSTNDAIRASQLLTPLQVLVMPVLREISASCGMALRLPPPQQQAALDLLQEAGVEGWRLFAVQSQGKEHLCRLLLSHN